MKKLLLLTLLKILLISAHLHGQQPKKPGEFLGYPLGSQFSYHHQVVSYFRHVGQIAERVIVKDYGKTYEQRELVVAFVSAPENLQMLDSIRINNLRRTGLLDGTAQENELAIVWLSYNVHGNEASSTETSMKVLYELAASEDSRYEQWLKNVLIIIDPCLNPDGRERYVNWYRQVGSVVPNPNVMVREHHEGWLHGRSNHYLFDLNRDWVWQTQVESQQRLALYNDWLPQVHVDLHEQGYNDKYYFAPAAQPMHQLVTPWQREFQKIVGKNHARYFDEHGWLYFTRERFDLLYPAYGDTYPIYNGAIGMTYEMAGHSMAGLAVVTEKGDTLTLGDRIDRHFTTSISTVEATYQNRKKLLEEFISFFKTSEGAYYVMQSERKDKLLLLAELLEKNKIRYYSPSGKENIQGYSYAKNQNMTINLTPNDLVVPLNQPKSTLVKVLFEKNTELVDSLTYDITAWSLPFAYGVDGYETEARINLTKFKLPKHTTSRNEDAPYAYLLNWESIMDARFLARIQGIGIKVNYSTIPFVLDSVTYSAGTLIITRIDNEKTVKQFHDTIASVATSLSRNLVPVFSGSSISKIDLGSAKIRYLKKPKIALLAGEGISTLNFGELWYFLEQEIKAPVDVIEKSMMDRIELDDYDALILASGSYPKIGGEHGFESIDRWVKKGGKLLLFGNAISSFTADGEFSLKHWEADEKDDSKESETVLYPYQQSERERLKRSIRGGIITLKVDGSHPLAYGYGSLYHTLKTNAVRYQYLKDGWNIGYITSADQVVAGYVGSETRENLEANLVFGVENRGRGRVVYFADNPLFRAFWQNGKLFVANALFFDN
jgi:hypothetical protein